MSDEEIAREAANKCFDISIDVSNCGFNRESFEPIILAAIKKAKEEDEEIDGGSRPL